MEASVGLQTRGTLVTVADSLYAEVLRQTTVEVRMPHDSSGQGTGIDGHIGGRVRRRSW